jgi:hypothetical protein
MAVKRCLSASSSHLSSFETEASSIFRRASTFLSIQNKARYLSYTLHLMLIFILSLSDLLADSIEEQRIEAYKQAWGRCLGRMQVSDEWTVYSMFPSNVGCSKFPKV